ncbi:MAG: chloride channel protein [Alphaproteobacteria bacterium]
MAIVIGMICGGLAIVFRETIELMLKTLFSANENNLYDIIKTLPSWYIIAITTGGGLTVGIIAHLFMPRNRAQGMTEVIETAIKKNHTLTLRTTIGSFFINVITLGTGGSAGREGPIVHLASGISSFILEKFKVEGRNRKILLGCAAASAVSSAFNAPIAGVFFASELITGSYAVSQFVPVVVASVSGAFLSNIYYGEDTAFSLAQISDISLYELPFFMILGILSAYFTKAFISGVSFIFNFAKNYRIPIWLCPAIGGLGVGLIAMVFPQVMGDGYAITNKALSGELSLYLLAVLVFAKLLATILTIGFGGGGGVFSPSLFMGAMLGGTFGVIVISLFNDMGISNEISYISYSVAGMGAVAGAVLGAPISTVFMIFELTNNYMLTLAVMLATFISARYMQVINTPSFFNWQLKNRGIDLDGGIENIAMRDTLVKDIMTDDFTTISKDATLDEVRNTLKESKLGGIFVVDNKNILQGHICLYSMADRAFDTAKDKNKTAIDVMDMTTERVKPTDNLEYVISLYGKHSETIVAVIDDNGKMIGLLHENDIIISYKNIVADTRKEERI